jgi:integrase
MAKSLSLLYKLERFDFEGVARFVVSHRNNFTVPVSASIYEAYLYSRRKPKKGTSGIILQHLLFFYSWAEFDGLDLELNLFTGEGIQLPEIVRFSNWLEARYHRGNKLSDGYVAHVVGDCKAFVLWFVKRYVKPIKNESLNITIHNAVVAHDKAWAECKINVVEDLIAEDIPDESYEVIEAYFKPDCVELHELSGAQLRNYIVWRLTWEFGLRIGEILALRREDLNFIDIPPYISVVRLDERDKREMDPRSPYQPKVKTLSRELGFLMADSSLISLLETYLTKERTRDAIKNGIIIKSVFLNHDFVFIVHDGSGKPLSCSAAQKISALAEKKSGEKFNWHLSRHAFFNRRYSEASTYADNAHLIDNLVYWGGWRSSESLKRYTRRATRDIARSGLILLNNKYIREEKASHD